MRHTAGHWKVGNDECIRITDEDGHQIAIATHLHGFFRRNPEEVHSNARLIAAAPDLLEACKVMRGLISDELTMDTNHGAWAADRVKAFEIADAAIAKAEQP